MAAVPVPICILQPFLRLRTHQVLSDIVLLQIDSCRADGGAPADTGDGPPSDRIKIALVSDTFHGTTAQDASANTNLRDSSRLLQAC